MNIIILNENDRLDDGLYSLKDDRFFHIKNILKLERGDYLEIGILNGPKGKAVINDIDFTETVLEIVEYYPEAASSFSIEIVCALPRPQTLKKVLNACAAMRVQSINLIRAEKVEKSYFQSPLLEEENYRKFLIEGLSQGKHTKLPEVQIYTRFKEFFKRRIPFDDSICLLADPSAKDYLSKTAIFKGNILFAIGPEAGWNDYEISYFKNAGFNGVKLSESILRVENAVVSAISQVELLYNTK